MLCFKHSVDHAGRVQVLSESYQFPLAMATTASLASPVAARAARHAICAAAAAPPRAPAAAPRSCRRAVPCRGAALVTRAEAAVAGAVTPVDVTLEEFNAMVAEEPAVLVDFYT